MQDVESLHVVGRPGAPGRVERDGAADENGEPIGGRELAAEAVGRHQDRAAARLEGRQVLLQPLLGALVEAGERLVEQQHAGPRQHEPREGQAALHARREGADPLVRGALELDAGERPGERGGRRAEPRERGPEFQVLEGGQVLVDVRAVRDEPDVQSSPLGVPGAVVSRDGGGAARGAHERSENLQERRLAGPVGAEHRDGLARADVEVDAVQHAVVAEGLAKTGHSDEWVGGHPSSVDCRRAIRAGQETGSLTRATALP